MRDCRWLRTQAVRLTWAVRAGAARLASPALLRRSAPAPSRASELASQPSYSARWRLRCSASISAEHEQHTVLSSMSSTYKQARVYKCGLTSSSRASPAHSNVAWRRPAAAACRQNLCQVHSLWSAVLWCTCGRKLHVMQPRVI